MNQILIAATVFLAFGILLCIFEILSKKYSLSSEWTRRMPHVSSALFTIFYSLYLSPSFLLTVLFTFSVIMFLSRRLNIFKHIHKVSRTTAGEELLPIGFIAAYLISQGNLSVFIPAVLIVGIADPLTGAVMQTLKSNIYGATAFIIIAVPILLIFGKTTLALALIIALISAVIERVSPYGTDNLTVPAAVALLLSIH